MEDSSNKSEYSICKERPNNLRDAIRRVRQKSCTSSYFVPEGCLQAIMTADNVFREISNSDIEVRHREEAVQTILAGARKTFAILVIIHQVSCITAFMNRDQLLPSTIDDKLPFSLSKLQEIMHHDADEFYEKQWEFIAPVFSRMRAHRLLDEDTILPFTNSTLLGVGGFGRVYETIIHPQHLGIPSSSYGQYDGIVRKELIETDPDGPCFKSEERILSFLNFLKHPNIVELLGSYTHKGVHNLLFPRASGTLATLFEKSVEQTRLAFPNEEAYLLALSGLSSALEKIHNYSSELLGIQLIGLHHDIKPENILVDWNRFLLSDFGLSRLKDAALSSRTPHRAGEGYYMAPECELADKDFANGIVSRPTDIWSLGCIIADMVTYMALGPQGVKDFKARREVTIAGYLTTYTFHGGSQPNDNVATWLSELSQETSHIGKGLIQLVSQMLSMDPSRRPNATEVTLELRILTLKSNFKTTSNIYKDISKPDSDLEIIIERERHFIWGKEIGLLDDDPSSRGGTLALVINTNFETIIHAFSNIQEELGIIFAAQQRHEYCVYYRLRMLNDDLSNILPLDARQRMQNNLELKLVSTEDNELLEKTRGLCSNQKVNRSIGILAAIKYMSKMTSEHSDQQSSQLHIRSDQLQPGERVDFHEQAWLLDDNGTNKRPVLVEYRKLGAQWTGERGKVLFERVQKLSKLLSFASNPVDFRILRCCGFKCDPSHLAFTMIYEFPPFNTVSADPLRPVALRRVFRELRERHKRPLLGDRFRLAYRIADALSQCHKVGWLHKNISSYNILFFVAPESTIADALGSPYIVGFNHSRPDDPKEFTEGLLEDHSQLDYQHPEYLQGTERYRIEFDYFSIGLVLLEIGLWKPLTDLVRDLKRESPSKVKQKLLEVEVPQLGYFMGRRYRDCVIACMEGRFIPEGSGAQDNVPISSVVQSEFRAKVVEPLSACVDAF